MRFATRLGALEEREFRFYFLGQAISLLGDGMAPLALAFAVLDLTGSPSDLGFVFTARMAPWVAFLLLGGVFADRVSRRGVMIAADLTRLGSQGLTAALLITHTASLWQVLVLQAVTGSGNGFFAPALTGLTPLVVSPGRLQQANALRGMAAAGGEIAGPAFAGALVATVGPGWALAADAGTYAASAALLAVLSLPRNAPIPVQSFLRDLREGWDEFRSRSWLVTIVLAACVLNLMYAPFFVFGPAICRAALGGPGAWALILAVFSTGALGGGLLALRLRPRRPLVRAFAAISISGLPIALLAVRAPAASIAAGGFLAGGALTLGNALWETTLQEQVPPHALSRVTAYDWFGSLAFQPVGYAVAGPVAGVIGVSTTLWTAAVTILVLGVVVASLGRVRDIEARSAAAIA
jgi:Major Facilitator Superfamily